MCCVVFFKDMNAQRQVEKQRAEAEKKRKERLEMDIRVQNLRKNYRQFFIVAIQQMQSRFSFSDPVFKLTELLKPSNAWDLIPQSLAGLFTRFPLLHKLCDAQKADNNWRSHNQLRHLFFGVESREEVKHLSAETYWGLVLNAKTANTDNCLLFPDLILCISLLLSLATSNAQLRNGFSAH